MLADAFQKERAGEWPFSPDPELSEWGEPAEVVGSYSTTAPIYWLRQHSRCDVALRSEYGDTRELAKEAH